VLRDCPCRLAGLPTDLPAIPTLVAVAQLGKRRAGEGRVSPYLEDLLQGCQGLILIALARRLGQAIVLPLKGARRFIQIRFSWRNPR